MMFCDFKFYLILPKLCHSSPQIAPKIYLINVLRKIAPNVVFKIVYKKNECILTVPSLKQKRICRPLFPLFMEEVEIIYSRLKHICNNKRTARYGKRSEMTHWGMKFWGVTRTLTRQVISFHMKLKKHEKRGRGYWRVCVNSPYVLAGATEKYMRE